MKKSVLFIAIMFLGILAAQEPQSTILYFEEKDFVFFKDEYDKTILYSYAFDNIFYDEDTLKPAIPYFIVNVLIGCTEKLDGFEVEYEGSVQKSSVILATNPKPISFGQKLNPSTNYEYEKTVYPFESKRCYLKYTGLMDGYRILQFAVTPFVYDASTQTLTLYTSLKLQWKTLTEKTASNTLQTDGGNMLEIMSSKIVNKASVEKLYPSVQVLSARSQRAVKEWGPGYLIICPQFLRSALEPLKMWQQKKGLKAEIETLESIYQKYQGRTNQIKIKRCIKDYYVNKGLKYVLLAGNGTCLPVAYCMADIPSDWFYACLDESDEYAFDWNANSDGIIGNITVDKVDLFPEVIVTRAPVETVADVQSFIAKIQAYELNPPLNNWYKDILFAGVSLRHSEEEPTDSEHNSRYFYDHDIRPYFQAQVQYFFGRKYDNSITKEGFQSKIQQGFHLIHMLTHGGETVFGLSDRISSSNDTIKGLYTTEDAKKMVCSKPSIFIALSCLTNAFDHKECLGRAFMNNPRNGVVAYLGTTRNSSYSCVNDGIPYGGIFDDHRILFRTLFNSSYTGMLGEAFCGAKVATISTAWMSNFYALNMCGDPAMLMYTEVPKKFNDITVSYSDKKIKIDAGVDNCIFSIQYKRGATIYKREYIENSRSCSILGDEMSNYEITLRHKNYITETISFDVKYIQNKIYSGNININGDVIIVGRDVTSTESVGDVIIESGKTVVSAARGVWLESGFEVKKGAELEINVQ